jgi:hypothetical protein
MLNTRSFWGSEWNNHVWRFGHSGLTQNTIFECTYFKWAWEWGTVFLKWLSSNGNTEILRFRSDVRGMFGHNQSNPRVSQSPTGYMLRSFRFCLLLWSTFYRFLGNDPSSSQSLELQPVISETRVVHLWLVVGSPRPLFRSDCFQSFGHYCITWIRCLKWLASSECQNLWSVRYRWTEWVWDITGWRLRLQEYDRLF